MKKLLICLLLIIVGCKNQNNNSKKTEFTWDFSEQQKIVYSYLHIASSGIQMWKHEDTTKTKTISKADLNIRVKDNNLADMSLTNHEVDMIRFDKNNLSKDTISNNLPTTVIQNMSFNGTFESDNHNIIYDIVFPLPASKLEIGETDKIPMKMPFRANGTSLIVKGFNSIKFLGFEKFEGKECAVLKSTFNLSEIEIPEELNGTYKCSATGEGTYFFSLENQHFLGSDIKLKMSMEVDSTTDKNSDSDLFGNMTSNNEVKIRFKHIEK